MGPETFNLGYQFAVNLAFLLFASLGLIVILGMINIINLAHGELIMLGAYTTSISYHLGIPFLLTLPLAFLVVGVFGMLLERFVLRRFYGNKLNAIVVTFGLSLLLSQGAFIVFGPYQKAVPMPFGGFQYGIYSYSTYFLVLAVASLALVAAVWLFFYRTRLGMEMRATMQNPNMARALGVKVDRIYMLTFGLGAGLAGLTGALYAPTSTVVPLFGQTFIAPAFITVVIGGGFNPLVGALSSASLLSAIQTPLASELGTFAARIGLMLAALVIIRILPEGLSYYLRDTRLRQLWRHFGRARKR